MDYDFIEIHFGEIWLRGRNRKSFIEMLVRNIERKLEKETYTKLVNANDRLLIGLDGKSDTEAMLRELGSVFGISWYAPAVVASNSIPDMIKKAASLAGLAGAKALKIVAHRSIKSTRFNSEGIVSSFLRKRGKLNFDLDKTAADKLYISVTSRGTLMHINKIKGLGGLPVGSSGKAIVLLSGGIDSPVAAFMAMKRGMEPIYLHMHAFQSNGEAVRSKMSRLLEALGRYSGTPKAYFAPSYIFQSHTLKVGKRYGKYETVLFKRFLFRLAERIAEKEGAAALVTGESIGQVSSQTIDNMKASEYGIKPFVIRPLIAFDKDEIIRSAKSIGTFDISIMKYKDVCAMGARNPKTSVKQEKIDEIYSSAGLDEALALTLEKTELLHI
ncbi:MAG: tRNA uracil 4-sulfurtransferase ThiI [Candidatus Micrarchaeaceae archaeon]